VGFLNGKTALVTGASGGIGRAAAMALAGEGASVIVHYNGSEARARETAERIRENGGRAELYHCEVRDYEAVGVMTREIIAKHGALDILVNNAGITRDGLLAAMTEEQFDEVIDVNLKGAFNCARHAARQMIRQRGGRMINVASVSGIMGNAGQANYAASKAGVIGFTKAAARELAPRGITVNAVAPGFIQTAMTEDLTESARTAALSMIPAGAFGSPEDVAAAVLFLAGPGAGYITGQILRVDGGMAI